MGCLAMLKLEGGGQNMKLGTAAAVFPLIATTKNN
jgi:hypothetical protein